MKTQNTNLIFKKSSISELNDNQLDSINGGSSVSSVTTAACLIAVSVVVIATVIKD